MLVKVYDLRAPHSGLPLGSADDHPGCSTNSRGEADGPAGLTIPAREDGACGLQRNITRA